MRNVVHPVFTKMLITPSPPLPPSPSPTTCTEIVGQLHSNECHPGVRPYSKMAEKKSRSAIRIKSSERERKKSAAKRDSATNRNKGQSVSVFVIFMSLYLDMDRQCVVLFCKTFRLQLMFTVLLTLLWSSYCISLCTATSYEFRIFIWSLWQSYTGRVLRRHCSKKVVIVT